MEVSETVYYGGNNRGLRQIIHGETHYFKCDGWRGLSGKWHINKHSQGWETAKCTEQEEVHSR